MTDETAATWRVRQRQRDYRDVQRGASVLVARGVLPNGVLAAVRKAIEQDYSPRSISQTLISLVASRRDNYDDIAGYFAAAVREQQARNFGKLRRRPNE